MLSLFSETMNKSMKDLFSINAGAVEKFSQQQTELLTGLMSDHINYASSLAKQQDYKEWLSVSQAYTESLRTRVLKSVNASYATFSETNEKTSKLLKTDAVAKAKPAPKPKPAVKAKPAATTKTAAKPATKTAAKPAAPAAAKPAAKPAPKKAAPKKAPVKKAVATETAAKPAPAKTAPVAPKATSKAAAKPAKATE